jgi:hypothetical protein
MIENLSEQQKQLLFDYCLGITSEEESAQAQELIFSNEDAAQLHNRLKVFFAPLESLGEEICPAELEEKTIVRLKMQARSSQIKLQQLIAAEQIRSIPARLSLLRNVGKMLAAAAVIFFVIGTYFSMAGYMRQQSWQTACTAQLQRIGKGLASYRGDNSGQLPMVAMAAGDPWWKVGYKPDSNENCSNTRHIYLLVRGNYVKPADFICPGAKKIKADDLKKVQAAGLRDFPGRQFISYSLRIRCVNATADKSGQAAGEGVLISDMNPLFENLPREFEQLGLQIDEKTEKLNSINHASRGQNVLFEDGSVGFFKTRHVGIDQDDIFTLRNTTLYQGNERPGCEADAFVAP